MIYLVAIPWQSRLRFRLSDSLPARLVGEHGQLNQLDEGFSDYDMLIDTNGLVVGFSFLVEPEHPIGRSDFGRCANVRIRQLDLQIFLGDVEPCQVNVMQIVGAVPFADGLGHFALALPLPDGNWIHAENFVEAWR